jgi:hypothetical protein
VGKRKGRDAIEGLTKARDQAARCVGEIDAKVAAKLEKHLRRAGIRDPKIWAFLIESWRAAAASDRWRNAA